MKVAIIHDYLDQSGGAERVLKAIHEIYPDAPVYTLIYDEKEMGDFCKDMNVVSSFIQRMPGGKNHFKFFIPFMPTAIERFDLSEFDVVISDSSSFSKGVITNPNTMHICYCHTPTRFLWHDTHSYTEELPRARVLKNLLPIFLTNLRQWDRLAADRVDHFLANSNFIGERIQKYYQRDSETIYPPVTLDDFEPVPVDKVGGYFLIGGRFRPYKRFDLAIKVFNKIGVPLKVFGDGEEEERLKELAGPNIEFLGRISEEEKQKLFSEAQAFLHPAEEDFGITPLEAMSYGRPVIAYGRGGALEIIIPGKTGEFFTEQTVNSFLEVVRNFDYRKYDPKAIRDHALTFNVDRFKKELKAFVDTKWEDFQSKNPQSFYKHN